MPDSEVSLARAPIEDGQADRVRDWYAELEERRPEVRATLDHEGVLTESAFVADHGDGDGAYLYVFMEATDLAAADAAGDEETFEVDEQHHAVLRETLAAPFEQLEPVAHFTNPSLR